MMTRETPRPAYGVHVSTQQDVAEPRTWWMAPWMDPIVAVAYLALSLVGAWHIPAVHGTQPADRWATIVCIAGAVGLALRHLSPRVMVALATVVVAVYGIRAYPGGPAYLALPLAILFYGLRHPRKESYVVAGATVVVAGGCMLVATPWSDAVALLGLVGWAVGAALVADVLRGRQERRETALRERREQEQRAQAEEQLWLARDLHDSVAHALTAIHVQSAIAARHTRTDPDAAEQSLEAIRQTTAAALDELGTIVRRLRASGEAPLSPSSSLSDIGELVDQVRRSGFDTAYETEIDAEPSRAVVTAAAYRVVQEALTNVVRHAPGAHVTVTVRRNPTEGLLVRIVNTPPHGAPRRHGGSGLGLVGMRERVEGSGGSLDHGWTSDGGYRVEARWSRP